MARLLIAANNATRAIEGARRAIVLVGGGQRVIFLLVVSPSLVTSPVSDSGAAVTPRLALSDDTGPEEVLASAVRQEADARSELDDALRMAHLDARVRVRVDTGEPGETICRVAEEERADLIVLGPHTRSRTRRLLLGSVSNYVLEHSHCPVLVVRAGAS